MALSHQHELHKRRLSRNVGVGAVLFAFVALLFALSFVKVMNEGNHAAKVHAEEQAAKAAATGANSAAPAATDGSTAAPAAGAGQ